MHTGPVAQSGQGAVSVKEEAQASGASCRGIEARRARLTQSIDINIELGLALMEMIVTMTQYVIDRRKNTKTKVSDYLIRISYICFNTLAVAPQITLS